MATRLERVVLDLDDRFTGGIVGATAATAAFDRQLNRLSGRAVSTSRATQSIEKSVTSTSSSLRKGGADIDRFSGRVRLLGEIALMLGPAFAPITAVAIPAVTGLAASLGFLAVGAGSVVVAFRGVGDALKALNEAHLDPTAENIAKAREAMEQIGPHAREFVRELSAMGPAFKHVRDAAAAGLFPGLVDSLDHIEGILPRVSALFNAFGDAIGDLASDATADLASDRWAEFFRFIQAEGPPTLAELGHALGDVAHGLAEMWMAFGPLNNDFTGWLRDSARAFDEWATGLSQTDGFQEFVDYIRENGPRVAEALGSIGNALVAVATAAAPLGGPVLEAISGIADVVALLAGSDVGAPLFALAAGMAAVSRAGKILGPSMGSISEAFLDLRTSPDKARTAVERFGGAAKLAAGGAGVALFAHSLAQTNDGLRVFESTLGGALVGLSTGNPLIAAAGAGLGALSGIVGALGNDSAESAARVEQLTQALIESKGAIDDTVRSLAVQGLEDQGVLEDAEQLGLDLNLVTEAALGNADAIATVTAALDQYHGSVTASGGKGSSLSGTYGEDTNAANRLRDAITGTNDEVNEAIGGAKRHAAAMGEQGDAAHEAADGMNEAKDAAQQLSDALAALSGWLDKRAALRDWDDAVRNLTKGLKDGFTREDVENVDAVGRSFIQVAESLKNNPVQQESFIDGAIKKLKAIAADAGPKAKAEIRDLIAQLREVGKVDVNPHVGLNPQELNAKAAAAERRMKALDALKANPKLDANDKDFQKKFGLTKADVEWLDGKEATAYLKADASQVKTAVGLARQYLNSIDGTSVTTYIATVHQPRAGGGPIVGPGGPTEDKVMVPASNGEFMMKAAAVRHYGLGAMYAMNEMRLTPDMTHARTTAALPTPYATAASAGGPSSGIPGYPTRGPSSGLPGMFAGWSFDHLLRALRAAGDQVNAWTKAIAAELVQRVELAKQEADAAKERLQALKDERSAIADEIAGKFSESPFTPQDQGDPLQIRAFSGLPANWDEMTREQQAAWQKQEREQRLFEFNFFKDARENAYPDAGDRLDADIAEARELTDLIRLLKKKGFDGPALAALLKEDNDTIEQYAEMNRKQLAALERKYELRQRIAEDVGQFGGSAAMGRAIKEQAAEVRESNRHLKGMRNELDQVKKAIKSLPGPIGDEVASSIDDVVDRAQKGKS